MCYLIFLDGDGYYSVVDGLAVLALMDESVTDLAKFARVLCPSFPKPPNMYVPLAGTVELSKLPTTEQPLMISSEPPLMETSMKNADLPIKEIAGTVDEHITTTVHGRCGRRLPLWARKSRYKFARVTYDPGSGAVVENDLPPPTTPVSSPPENAFITRRSTRSTASAFRRPQSSPLVSDLDVPSSHIQVLSPLGNTTENIENSLSVGWTT